MLTLCTSFFAKEMPMARLAIVVVWVLVGAHYYILLSDGTSVVLVDAILITNRLIHLVWKSLLPWIVSEKLLPLIIPRLQLLISLKHLAHVIINHLCILTLDVNFRGWRQWGLVRVLATRSPIAYHET